MAIHPNSRVILINRSDRFPTEFPGLVSRFSLSTPKPSTLISASTSADLHSRYDRAKSFLPEDYPEREHYPNSMGVLLRLAGRTRYVRLWRGRSSHRWRTGSGHTHTQDGAMAAVACMGCCTSTSPPLVSLPIFYIQSISPTFDPRSSILYT